MLPVSRCFLLSVLGLMFVACFNSSKTTKVEPGATSVQPETTCQLRGASCRMNSDCCMETCEGGTCIK
jgi:hypothetical protein